MSSVGDPHRTGWHPEAEPGGVMFRIQSTKQAFGSGYANPPIYADLMTLLSSLTSANGRVGNEGPWRACHLRGACLVGLRDRSDNRERCWG